jgi:hypothetical protein
VPAVGSAEEGSLLVSLRGAHLSMAETSDAIRGSVYRPARST